MGWSDLSPASTTLSPLGRCRLGDGRFKCTGCDSRTSSDSRHHLRPDPHSTHGLVFSLLAFCYWQRRDLGAELEADLGDRLLPDSVGDPSSLAVCADSSRWR